ncbi:MAG TPA: MFS transporter [Victivallales bacterium]|nr:MFS transporter [Victivallales bacterium]
MKKLLSRFNFIYFQKDLNSVYLTVVFSEFSTSMATPLFTFLIFSQSSTLIPEGLPYGERAMIFAAFISLYKLATLISNPIFGTLSDIVGRKTVFNITAAAMIILSVFTIISLIMHSFVLFIIGACLYGLLWALESVATASINDLSSNKQRVTNLSLMQFCIGIGVGLGPMIGGYIGVYSVFGYKYMAPFIVLLIISILLQFYIIFFFKETYPVDRKRKHTKTKSTLKNLKIIFSNKNLYLLMLIHVLNQLSWGTYYDFIPAITKTVFKYNVKEVGIFVGCIGIGLIISTGFILPFLRKYLDNLALVKLSCGLQTTGIAISLLVSFFPHLLIADIGIWFGILPVVAGDVMLFCILVGLFSESVGKELQGTIVGLVYVVGMAMWSLGAPFGGLLMKWKLNGPLLISLTSMILLIIVISLSSKKLKSIITLYER